MSNPWEVIAAVAQRNGLDALVLCGHLTSHHDPYATGQALARECEAAAVCLLDGLPPALAQEMTRAAGEVTGRYLGPALEAAGVDPAGYRAVFDTTPLAGGGP